MNGNFSGSLLTQVIEIVHIIKTKKKKKKAMKGFFLYRLIYDRLYISLITFVSYTYILRLFFCLCSKPKRVEKPFGAHPSPCHSCRGAPRKSTIPFDVIRGHNILGSALYSQGKGCGEFPTTNFNESITL